MARQAPAGESYILGDDDSDDDFGVFTSKQPQASTSSSSPFDPFSPKLSHADPAAAGRDAAYESYYAASVRDSYPTIASSSSRPTSYASGVGVGVGAGGGGGGGGARYDDYGEMSQNPASYGGGRSADPRGTMQEGVGAGRRESVRFGEEGFEPY